MTIKKQKSPSKGIYILPNLFTIAGLFAGFYAIVAAMKGHYDTAAVAIFIAMLLDGFDGRVARLTGTESAFGAELDSLADMVSFGIAPALVSYSWALHYLHKPGWLAAFVFVACAAMRLARFNTQIGVASKKYFQGLPSPAAAGVLASLVWLCESYHITMTFDLALVVGLITALTGLLMVSRVRYYSFKELNVKNKVPFIMMLLVLLVVVAVVSAPVTVLFIFFFGYAISGLFISLFYTMRRRRYLLTRLKRRKNKKL
tara:strand:+ start:116404 stop:117177 length:774 start_codon:yes stop_codon:yes gene_type:complete